MRGDAMIWPPIVVLVLAILCLEDGDVVSGMGLLGFSMGLAVPALVALCGGGK